MESFSGTMKFPMCMYIANRLIFPHWFFRLKKFQKLNGSIWKMLTNGFKLMILCFVYLSAESKP